MKKIFFYFLFFISVLIYSQKNEQIKTCGSDDFMQELIRINPEVKERINRMDTNLNLMNEDESVYNKSSVTTMITIPVVVIIIHSGGSDIPDSQVNNQIAAMNNYFNNYGINFCLATRTNANGTSSSPGLGVSTQPGISHYNNYTLSHHNALTDQQALVNTAAQFVDGQKYLRIWVVRSINGLGTNVAGYSAFPNSSSVFDGVVIKYNVFGNGNSNLLTNYNQGKTLIHEVGHYLGLYHTFHEGCAGMNSSTWNTQGDRVSDTPPVQFPNFACSTGANSCNEASPDLPDNINNFMDYGNDNCVNEFTQGQKQRMFNVLSTYRSQLFSHDNLIITGVCNSQNLLSATFTASFYSACTTTAVNFFPVMTGVNYQWDFGDGSPISTLQNPSHMFTSSVNSPYTVTLTVTNLDNTQSVVSTVKIYVKNCTSAPNGSWYVSLNNMINFNTGIPVSGSVPLENAAGEAATVQNNASGDLLFYSNSIKIYNSSNVALNATNLSGNTSSRDGVIAIPNPSNANQYYVFTTDAQGGLGGLRYSLVNVSGTTVTLSSTVNTAVSTPTANNYLTGNNGAIRVGEGIAVAQHCSGYWIAVVGIKSSGQFLMIYNLTSSGLSFVSEFALSNPDQIDNSNLILSLKFSPNQNKLIVYRNFDLYNSYLFEFNKFNGTIMGSPIIINNGSLSAAIFSPNSNLLYTYDNNGYINQYNLSSSNVVNSRRIISRILGQAGSLQIGPDNKIYGSVVLSNLLFTIHNPNNIDTASSINACGYVREGVPLINNSSFALPNLINAKLATSFPAVATISSYPTSCNTYKFAPNTCTTLLNWNFGDSASGANNTSTSTHPTHTFTANGTYTVTLRNSSNVVIATTTVIVGFASPTISGNNSICPSGYGGRITNNSIVLLPGYSVVWSVSPSTAGVISGANNQSDVTVNWSTTGTLVMTVTSPSGCVNTVNTPIIETVLTTPTISGSSATCTTPGNNTTVNTTTIPAGYTALWTVTQGVGTITGATTNTATVNWTSLPGAISLALTTSNGCTEYASKVIIDQCMCNCLPTIYFTNSVSGSTVNLNIANSNSSCPSNINNVKYVWTFGDGTSLHTNSLTASHTYSTSGTYTVGLIRRIMGPVDEVLCEERRLSATVVITAGRASDVNQDVSVDEQVIISPNPTSSNLNISLNLKKPEQVLVVIKSVEGKELMRNNWSVKNGNQIINFDLPNSISDGSIFVEVSYGDYKVIKTIIVKK